MIASRGNHSPWFAAQITMPIIAIIRLVSHPMNHFLDETISQFKKLTNNNERFSDFKNDKLINASRPFLKGWVKWYEKVYYGLDV
jgi:hypothetical protein